MTFTLSKRKWKWEHRLLHEAISTRINKLVMELLIKWRYPSFAQLILERRPSSLVCPPCKSKCGYNLCTLRVDIRTQFSSPLTSFTSCGWDPRRGDMVNHDTASMEALFNKEDKSCAFRITSIKLKSSPFDEPLPAEANPFSRRLLLFYFFSMEQKFTL